MAAFNRQAIKRAISPGYTLVEMMISLVVMSLIMLAMVSGAIALQRSFSAVDGYSTALGDQARVLDFICRDIRNSLSTQSPQVQISTGPTTVQVTTAQYYDSSGNVITPTVSGTSATYGSTSNVITYTLNGTTLTRTVGSATPTVISNNIASFTAVLDTTDAKNRTVKISLTFNSKFQAGWNTAGTALSATVTLRN